MPQGELDAIRDWPNGVATGGSGVIGRALLFGAGALLLTMLVVPMVDDQARPQTADGIDRMVTGATGSQAYTIRRSVLQPSPDAVCVIRANGLRMGECRGGRRIETAQSSATRKSAVNAVPLTIVNVCPSKVHPNGG